MEKNKLLFLISIAEQRVSYGGWVSFSHLKSLDEMFETSMHHDFTEYCKKYGCTLTVTDGQSKAPWRDFKNFLLDQSPDD